MDQDSPHNAKRDFSSEWLKLLVDAALDGIVTMDTAGRILAFNPAAEKIFGYKKEHVIGHLVSDKLIPPSQRQSHEQGLKKFLSHRKGKIIGHRIKMEGMRASGEVFPAEIEVLPVSPEKAPVFCAYIRDISEQEQFLEERLSHVKHTKKILLQTILAFSKAIEIRDPYTAGHQHRVAHLAASMAGSVGFSEEDIEGIFLGALIHDIGKIAVPAEILSRPGKLMSEDKEYIRLHCQKGFDILKPIDFPWPIAQIALQHHEHIDGSGYPQSLRKGDILTEAHLISVADVVEALTSHRPYRPAYSLDETLKFVIDKAGSWFEPDIVTVCVDLFNNGYRIDAANMEELFWQTGRINPNLAKKID